MINIKKLNHLSIVVDDVIGATSYYQNLFQAEPVIAHSHFKNKGFASAAGFIENPEEVEVSIRFLKIPNVDIVLELIEYHRPKGRQKPNFYNVNDVCGVRHIGLQVVNIDKVFSWIKTQDEIKFINSSEKYKPYKMDELKITDVELFGEGENNEDFKSEQCKKISSISFFYFLDKYGIQWEIWEEAE